jgi:death-on-curing protein
MIVSLDKALVLAIHDRQLAEHGGSSGVRDDTLLESALARPEQLHAYGDPAPDLADLAAALAYGLARNHPFVDGNKRTAYIACRTFLALNGADISASAEQKYLTVLALAEGHLSAAEFAAWLRAHGERVQAQPAPPTPPQIPLVARASAAPPRSTEPTAQKEITRRVRFLPAHASYNSEGWRREPLAGLESLGN